VLGLQIKQAGTNWIIFSVGSIEFVVMAGATIRANSHTYGKTACTVLCFETANIDRDYQKLQTQGVTFFSNINTVPQGRFVAFADPDGNPIELIEPLHTSL
jgi:predicted enzyme related to lactoylglutathione lyase